jgi:hypothetical protein
MAPFRKKAETRLAEARAALSDTSRQIGVLEAQRNAALLADDDPTAAKLYAELETLRGLARGHADKVALLEAEATREEAEAVVKRRADLVVRFEKKLAQADAEAVELQELIAQAEKKFRKIITLRTDARAAWPIADSNANATAGTAEGAALSGGAVAKLLQFEFYRIGARPFLGGRPGEIKEQDFPGAVCPRNEWRGRPMDIMPFADALKQASAFAVSMMRGKLDPLAAVPPAAVSPPATSTIGESLPSGPVRSEVQERLAELLRKQAALADDLTPAGEQAYRAVVAEIAALS